MKQFKLLFVVAFALMSAGAPVQNTYTLSKDYTVVIHGTSNLHAWDETVGTVTGTSTVTWNSDGSFNLDAINIKMDVHSIKSDMGSIMNNNTYKALKADANPAITFAISTPVKSIPANANNKLIIAAGNLTIAGVTKPVTMQVKVFIQEHGALQFEGAQTIKMTDFDVNPPTALFGTLKTGDVITINFKTSFTAVIN